MIKLSELIILHEVPPTKTHKKQNVLALLTSRKHKNLALMFDTAESLIDWRDAIRNAATAAGANSTINSTNDTNPLVNGGESISPFDLVKLNGKAMLLIL